MSNVAASSSIAPEGELQRDFRPELAQLVVVFSWASTFILTKDVFEHLAPLAYGFVRFAVVAAVALGVLAVRGWGEDPAGWWQVDRADIPRFVLAGLSGYTMYQVAFAIGLDNTSPFSSSLMIATVPLFTLLIVTCRGERSPVLVWAGAGIALAGVAVFLSDQDGGGTWLGNGLSAVAAVTFALYGVIGRPLAQRYRPETVAAWTTVCGAVPFMVLSLPAVGSQHWSSVPLGAWVAIVYMGVLPVYAAYMLWNWAIRRRGVSATSWILLVPILSGVFSAIHHGEGFGLLKVTGATIALLGLILMRSRSG